MSTKQSRRGFTNRKTGICPDCLDRNAIDIVGRPRRRGGWDSTYGCENCQGNGYVRLADKNRRDPYDKNAGFSA